MIRVASISTVLSLSVASLALLSGCGSYYYQGGAGASSSYGQSGVVYNGQYANGQGQGTQEILDEDGNVIGITAAPQGVQGQPGQEVYIGADGDDYVDTDPSALSEFRGALDPYGTWYDDGTYGTVWIPSQSVVGADFAPYVSAGHWTYADDYTWVSDYDWGWAPFHYGRWVYITNRGWSWIPGRRYAGAWVSWRTGNAGYGYVGWGPLAPTWYWRSGVAVGLTNYPPTPYTFCATGDLFHPVIQGRVVAGPAVQNIAAGTRLFTPAQPGVTGRTPASPTVGGSRTFGPAPSTLGIQPQAVVPLPGSDRGLLRAQQFARPGTAVAAGAHAPQVFASPRLPSTVVQGGAQAYTRPPQQIPPPSYQQYHPGTGSGGAYTPPPSYQQRPPQGYSPPPSAYTPPPNYQQRAPTYNPPPSTYQQAPAYRPPPTTYQQAPAYRQPSSPPPTQQYRPSSPPPQVRSAPPAGGGGRTSAPRR